MKEVTLNFSIEEVNILLKGLAELPAKESFNVINKIYSSVQQQQAPVTAEDKPAGKEVKMEAKK